ncbi:MAG: dihydroorotase, partial [Bacteroidota bacterium]|nr:dihydroorotase [Bacteroidota bacterium]
MIRDPQSTWHNQKVDIQVEEGSITQIAPDLSGYDPSTEVPFNSESPSEVNVMPGWVDPHVEGGEPGFEARETIE